MGEHWNLVTSGIALAFSLKNILLLILGSAIGIVIGVLPGIGPVAGMALLLPLTFGWHPETALIMMGAIFFSSSFGGSVTSILINAPGDTNSAATLLDGYPMTQQGRGAEAIGVSATSVIVGGGVGVILLIASAPVIAVFALRFGPAETALLAVFALSIIASMVTDSPVKGLISAGIGLSLATMGYDGTSGIIRFSFGISYFEDEIQLIPAVVGVFAVTQVITLSAAGGTIARVEKLAGSLMEGVRIYFHHPVTILHSLVIGIFIGALPAASESIALVVKNDAPYKDMADFVKEHKKKSLSSAVAGVGGGAHFNGMNLARHLGLTVKWVPFDGGTQSLAALAGGHVDYTITDIGNVTTMVAAKTIRLLMIFGDHREPRYPDIPTSKELGYGITVIPSLRAVLGPPGLPATVVKTLESAYKKTAQDTAFQALAAKANVRVNPKDAKETFALSKNTWTAFKDQEEHLRSVMKSGK